MSAQELATTAAAMVATGKGVLAIDESMGTIQKRFDTIGLENTEPNRRAYRDLLIANNGDQQYISGMILFDETIRQSSLAGVPFAQLLTAKGIMPGIKVDGGAKDLAGRPGEQVTEGLDGLRERLAGYKALGAKFAKWRAVITIGHGIPTSGCVDANAHALARYAALCQAAGIVPMVEPEVLMDADNTIDRCGEVTAHTLRTLFQALVAQNVVLEHTILKINMVVSGKLCPVQAGMAEIAEKTVSCLKRTVPAAIPGIVFLSGGQSGLDATRNLNAMNVGTVLPWPLSFSYGRALQADALAAWGGKPAQVARGQQVLLHRERCNSLAARGHYSAAVENELPA
ncbi:MAG: fructose-bisphosphate aldolase class I [Gammaproteobacteria bacterium]|nr:fructose-bisphosphate aldolase class I [Gammaproteobacteria bacterium]